MPDAATSLVGRSLALQVHTVQVASGRLRVSLKRDGNTAGGNLSPRARLFALYDPSASRQLETLETGDELRGATILSVHPFGAFVSCGVCRAARGGRRVPIAALLPADQLPSTSSIASYTVGQQLDVRVLRPSPSHGRLLLTARELDAAGLLRLMEERAQKRKRASRRPSLAALAAQPGAKREGVVESLAPYGVVVNVGARKTGLIHVSQLRRGFVSDPSDVCNIGDRVMVQVLKGSTGRKLSLRLVKVFPRDESEMSEQQATLRRGETLTPIYTRAEDLQKSAAEAAVQDEMEAMWAQRDGAAGGLTEEEEEDPWAWAAAEVPPSAPAAADEAGDEDGDDSRDESDGPDFGQDYFEDKYDIDYY